MRLAIQGIQARGLPNKEMVHLRVWEDTDLQYYVLMDTTYVNPGNISNLVRHSFWFTAYWVRRGDHVFVFTGNGQPNSFKNQDGSTSHVFYWGLNRTIWNNLNDCAIIFELAGWVTSAYRQTL